MARTTALLAWHTASLLPPTDRWATTLRVTDGRAHLPDGRPFTGGRHDHIDLDPDLLRTSEDADGEPTIDPLTGALADPGPAPLTGVMIATTLQRGWRPAAALLLQEVPDLLVDAGTSAVRVLAVRAAMYGEADGPLIAELGWAAMAVATRLIETQTDIPDETLIRERVAVIRSSRRTLTQP